MSVTYLVGAGASFNCLPVVSNIPQRYSSFVRRFRTLLKNKYGNGYKAVRHHEVENPDDSHADQYKLYRTLKRFEQEIHNHLSIDTYAKKLYLSGALEDLRLYKFCLSLFFTFEQILNGPDTRYDAFFASILGNGKSDFPAEVRILSWNYDFQFEVAYSSYAGVPSIEYIGEDLPVVTAGNIERLAQSQSKFQIIKLNGSAEVWEKDQDGTEFTLNARDYRLRRKFIIEDMKLMANLFGYYRSVENSTTLSFAWEYQDHKSTKRVIEHALESSRTTKTLVVIGYSFPLVNKQIDQEIIGNMSELKRIYVQDPNATEIIEKVAPTFGRRSDGESVEFVPVTGTAQFFLPYDLK